MYVFLSVKISNVILSGWLTYNHEELFKRDKKQPFDPAQVFRGQVHDNPRKLPNVQCLSSDELPKLMLRLDMLTDDDAIEVQEVLMVGAYSRRLLDLSKQDDEE